MRTVVVYESMFGNTKTIAEAIAEGLGEAGEVTLGSVDDLSPDQAADASLLVARPQPSTPAMTSPGGSPGRPPPRSPSG